MSLLIAVARIRILALGSSSKTPLIVTHHHVVLVWLKGIFSFSLVNCSPFFSKTIYICSPDGNLSPCGRWVLLCSLALK